MDRPPSLLDKDEIAHLLPFAPAWILVDQVAECSPPEFIRTHKLVTATDPSLAGRFSGDPLILPSVLLIEFVSQSACLLGALSEGSREGVRQPHVLARCSSQFLSPAYAGDLLTAEVKLDDASNGVTLHEATVRCGERMVCRARIFATGSPVRVGGREKGGVK